MEVVGEAAHYEANVDGNEEEVQLPVRDAVDVREVGDAVGDDFGAEGLRKRFGVKVKNF